MRRGLICGVVTLVAALGVFTAGATASGPAPPGKDVINLTCVGLGPVQVSVTPSESNNGAGQLVGRKGHGIAVRIVSTATDITLDPPLVVGTETFVAGHGHAHPHQTTTQCSGVVFSAPASVFFDGQPLPQGVSPNDTIQVSIVADVIIKL